MSVSLQAFFLKVNKEEELKGTIFREYNQCITDNPTEDSVEQLEKIAEIFVEMLKKTQGEIIEEDVEALSNIVNYISSSPVVGNTSGILFARFLYNLNKRKKLISSNDLVKSYNSFEDIIEKCQWLFSIKNSDSLKVMFPVKDLIVGLVDHFEVDDEHLIHLAIMLQLYNSISIYKNKDTEIEKSIKKIIEEHGIKCLEYLLHDDGHIVIDDYNDYYKNGTLIFQSHDKVLIRNTSKHYFSTLSKYKVEEEKDNNEVIAYYIEKTISNSSELRGFKEIMYSSDSKLKLEVLNGIFETNNYNIFIGKKFIVNSSDNRFEGFLNDFGEKDEFIILRDSDQTKNNNINNFFESLEEKLYGFRDISIIRSGANILTLDFIIHFHKEVSSKFNYRFKFSFENDSDLYQNKIIKDFFLFINDNTNYIEYCKSIENYYSFIHKYLEIDYFGSMNSDMALIMPYEIYLPFDDPIINITSKIPDLEKLEYKTIQYTSIPKLKFKYEKEDGSLIEVNGYNFEKRSVKETGGFTVKADPEYIEVFLNLSTEVFYYDTYTNEIIRKMYKLLDIKSEFSLNKTVVSSINNNNINDLINVIYEVKLNRLNYEVFRTYISNEDSKKCSIILYKVLWHFRLFNWELTKITLFFDIILKKHYIKSATKKDIDESVPKFVGIIRSEIEKDGVLVIRKENEVNQGTLDRLISRYYLEGERESLYKTQNLEYLQNNIQYSNDLEAYTFEGNEIKKILIFVDNIMGGCSTQKMLDYYLKGGSNRNKSYVKIGKKTSQLVKINKNVEVEVLSIWSFQKGIEFIEQKFKDFSLKVNTVKEIPDCFCLKKSVEDKIEELYGDYASEDLPKYLIIRANNMPKKTIYNEDLFNTKKLIGLFNRMDEI